MVKNGEIVRMLKGCRYEIQKNAPNGVFRVNIVAHHKRTGWEILVQSKQGTRDVIITLLSIPGSSKKVSPFQLEKKSLAGLKKELRSISSGAYRDILIAA